MTIKRIDDLANVGSSGLTRRSALRRGAAVTALLGGGLAVRSTAAQDATPRPVEQVPGTVGTLFSVIATNLPAGEVDLSLARVVSQPGDGDLEDYFTFPGPVAFVIESGTMICRCGTADDPCLHLHADGTSTPAPPSPEDIELGPGEGLYIPANTPDSFFVAGAEPVVELDVAIFPSETPPATPAA